jgi:clan AA aspartic protease
MRSEGERSEGRFSVQFEVANHEDVILALRGLLEPNKIRRLTISALVDSGATRLILPEKIVKQLGLPFASKVKVRYANNHTATRDAVNEVSVQIQGLKGVFNAVVEPKHRDALIGAIVLEDLDFVVECT